jgi:hypothetical protein
MLVRMTESGIHQWFDIAAGIVVSAVMICAIAIYGYSSLRYAWRRNKADVDEPEAQEEKKMTDRELESSKTAIDLRAYADDEEKEVKVIEQNNFSVPMNVQVLTEDVDYNTICLIDKIERLSDGTISMYRNGEVVARYYHGLIAWGATRAGD